jgi:hypothetical protein
MTSSAPIARSRAALLSFEVGRDHPCACELGELQREYRDVPRALGEDGLAADHGGAAGKRGPGGQPGGGQGRGLGEREVPGYCHDALLAEQGDFGEHAVEVGAERSREVAGVPPSGRPQGQQDAGDTVTGAHARHPLPGLHDLSGAIGERVAPSSTSMSR